MKRQNAMLVLVVVLMIIAAALSRVFFYPINYSPVIAMALFGGAVIKDKKFAFALPLFAMFLSDIMFEVFNVAPGFWGWGQVVGYCILGLITVIGFRLKKLSVINIAGFSILTSVVFYLLSNSSLWLLENPTYRTYSQDFSGYISCMVAGLPFLEKGFMVDLGYSALFFGGYLLLEKYAVKDSNAIAR
ncbi:MAG: DUF6580 family putative transport protein [Ferruginibacter sp.]